MIQRLVLFVASLAAAFGLAFGLAATGLVPIGHGPVAGPVTATTAPQPEPRVQVDTVYLAPPAPPQEVTITRAVQGQGERDDEGEERGDD